MGSLTPLWELTVAEEGDSMRWRGNLAPRTLPVDQSEGLSASQGRCWRRLPQLGATCAL